MKRTDKTKTKSNEKGASRLCWRPTETPWLGEGLSTQDIAQTRLRPRTEVPRDHGKHCFRGNSELVVKERATPAQQTHNRDKQGYSRTK